MGMHICDMHMCMCDMCMHMDMGPHATWTWKCVLRVHGAHARVLGLKALLPCTVHQAHPWFDLDERPLTTHLTTLKSSQGQAGERSSTLQQIQPDYSCARKQGWVGGSETCPSSARCLARRRYKWPALSRSPSPRRRPSACTLPRRSRPTP